MHVSRCGVFVEALELLSNPLLNSYEHVYCMFFKLQMPVKKLKGNLASQCPLIVWFKYCFTFKCYILVFIYRSFDIWVYSIYTAVVDLFACSLLGIHFAQISKDITTCTFTAEEVFPESGGQVSASDVVLFGLNTIIPLMNEELLTVNTSL